jgi:hypothetical protein
MKSTTKHYLFPAVPVLRLARYTFTATVRFIQKRKTILTRGELNLYYIEEVPRGHAKIAQFGHPKQTR